jgi:hypothetical protein
MPLPTIAICPVSTHRLEIARRHTHAHVPMFHRIADRVEKRFDNVTEILQRMREQGSRYSD